MKPLNARRRVVTRDTADRLRVLYVEGAPGFGGSLTGLLHLFRALPEQIEPVLVTCFDPRPFVELPGDLIHHQLQIPQHQVAGTLPVLDEHNPVGALPACLTNPVARQSHFGRVRAIARYYRYVIAPWLRGLDPLVRHYQPQLIHANNSLVSNYAVGLVARRRGVPSISHQKGFEHPGRFTRLLARHSRFDHHLATSGAIAEHLVALGVPRQRCTTIYEPVIGPDANQVAHPDRRPVPLVAMHSMLVPEKGQHVFLRAIAELAARGSFPFRAVIAGTSPDGARNYADSLARLAADLGLASLVEFPGHMRYVYEFLSDVDLAVHAAVEAEPFGRVVAEAMLSGLPCIVTADGGPAEYIQQGVTGFCVPRGDHRAMANAIEQLLSSPDLRRSMGIAARQFALCEFEPARLARQLVDVYEDVLNRSRERIANHAPRHTTKGSSNS